MNTRLFHPDKVRKYFDILTRLNGGYPIDKSKQIYKGYDKSNPHLVKSQRDVFVNRTIAKWLKGKYLIIYKVSDLGVLYKQYVSITHLSYNNDWSCSGYISVGLMDYANPYHSNLFDSGVKYNHNEVLNLEGEWCENSDKHNTLLKLVTMDDIPEKEFKVLAYDFDKYPKNKNISQDEAEEMIKTTLIVKARTYHEFYQKLENLRNKYKKDKKRMLISDIISVE